MKIQKTFLFLLTCATLASCGAAPQPSSPTDTSVPATSSAQKSSEEATSSAASTSQQPSSQQSSSQQPSSSSSSVAPAEFTITFKDEEGNLLESKKWLEGQVPSYKYEKEDTAEWDYTVKGWALSLGGEVIELPAVSADATYYAVVAKTKQKYTITFDTQGGSSIDAKTLEYGAALSEPDKPKRDGYKFVAWTYDTKGENKVNWPITVTKNETLYANWNKTLDIKGFLKTLVGALKQDPYSFIPDSMKPEYAKNHVKADDVAYDFTTFNNVSDIRYGGFGEQWRMVIDNIKESERFYSIVTLGESILDASVVVFNNYLDSNPGDTASHTVKETKYTAKLNYSAGILSYTLQYKTGFNIPLFGEVTPQIDLAYNVAENKKSARIQLSENNAMRYVVTDDSYVMALEYGVTALSRKAYLQIEKDEDGKVDGHIYEFVQFKDKDLLPACADFYIDGTYASVVGNKASGIPGFTGYINELYKADQGKLLGYEVRETINKWGVTATYHTLWFNLSDINGIRNVKAIKNDESAAGLGGKNDHDIYLNDGASIFEPAYNTKLTVKTSRKYDVEMRKQYFYGYESDKLVEYETSIPMMFIQADHDGYTNFTDFPSDMKSKSGITATVGLSSAYLEKIQSDYATLIDIFIQNKGTVTSDAIDDYIGNPAVIE